MTPRTVIQITKSGELELPPEIRSRLQPGDEFLLWEEKDFIVIKKVEKSLENKVNPEADSRFFEIADRLAELKETLPISEEEIQEEIKAYKLEKRNLT
jgi:hypothetical protein